MAQIRPMHQWVRVLEAIRERRGVSKNFFETNNIMTRSQFNTLLKAKRAPRIDTLERLLRGMGASWKDWAEAVELDMQARPLQRRQPEQPSHDIKKKAG